MENTDLELGDVDIIQSTVQNLLDCVENEKNHTNKPHQPSIYRVPSVFRDLSPSSFSPRVVSVGPLHREDEKLKEFESYKASYAHMLLHRLDSTPEETLQACVQKVCESIEKVRKCYAEPEVVTYGDAELAKMMVLDACFILEYIFNFSKRKFVGNTLFELHVLNDLFLLENQIPFFVLDDIFQCTILKLRPHTSIGSFVFPVIRYIYNFRGLKLNNISTDTIPHHILGLLHHCYRPKYDIASDGFGKKIQSATELDIAGVNFKPNRNAEWSMAMEVKSEGFPCLFWFWGKPTLRMPVLEVNDYSELLLRNLMAYEQSTLGCSFVASYLAAMDMLIDTEKDIATLVKSKVFVNFIGSDDEAAQMINNICKDVAIPYFHYNKQWKILDSHCNSYWPKNVAWLRRTYFNSPWNIIALLAGIILFSVTVVQTIFTIKAT